MFKIENDLLWVGMMIGILFFLWLFTGGPSRIQNGPFVKPLAPVGTGESYGDLSPIASSSLRRSNRDYSSSTTLGGTSYSIVNSPNNYNQNSSDIRTSRYKGLITLGYGNASSENNPNKEYITIRGSYNIKDPINISGWTLKNGGSERYYNVSGQTLKGQSSTVKIPKAVLVWKKVGPMNIVPVKISADQTVQVVSGNFPPIGEYTIRDSFRVNKCTGYISNQEGYYNIFSPGIYTNCPRVQDEPGASTLYDQCYDFVRSLGTCQKPDFKEDWCYANTNGSARYTTVCNLPSSCKVFIQKYASYENCVSLHQFDKDFLENEWRVFLGSTWEIWSSRRETITLYDNEGKIVDQLKYQ